MQGMRFRNMFGHKVAQIMREKQSKAVAQGDPSYQAFMLEWAEEENSKKMEEEKNLIGQDEKNIAENEEKGKKPHKRPVGLCPYLGSPENYTQLSDLSQHGCEILLVITMYDESFQMLDDSMRGVSSSLKIFEEFGVPKERIAVCVIVDGIEPFLKSRKKDDNSSEVFRENDIISYFNPKNNDIRKCKAPADFLHTFMVEVKFQENSLPVQMFFCVKNQNRGKLNSHLWFFGGFCQQIQPKYIFTLDVGTIPQPRSIYYLFDAMERDANVAGCCGEIEPVQKNYKNYVIPAQTLEYKFSHIFDKALESLIGIITVLPGAFSGYRWAAINGKALWKDYFKPELNPYSLTPFEGNRYLAEDRVLCLSLVTERNQAYKLKYVNYAKAYTDIPDNFSDLIVQRRRWINGSWFALIHLIKSYGDLWRSGHSPCRKIAFYLLLVYFIFNVVFSWFLVAIFFVFIIISFREFEDYDHEDDFTSFSSYILAAYVLILIVIIITSLTIRLRKGRKIYRFISVVLGLFMILSVAVIIYLFAENEFQDDWVSYVIIACSGIFALNVVFNCSVLTLLKCIFFFLFMMPSYVNILYIVAIFNTHDVTWAGEDKDEQSRKLKDKYEMFRYRWCLIWIVCNLALGYGLDTYDEQNSDNSLFYVIAIIGGVLILLRTMFAIIYFVLQIFEWKFMKNASLRRKEDPTRVVEVRRAAKDSTIVPLEEEKVDNRINSTFLNDETSFQKYDEKVDSPLKT